MKIMHNVVKHYCCVCLLAVMCVCGFVSCDEEPFDAQTGENVENGGSTDEEIEVPFMGSGFFIGTWYPSKVVGEIEFHQQQNNFRKVEEILGKCERLIFRSDGTGNHRWNNTYSGNQEFTWRITSKNMAILWKGSRNENYYDVIVFNNSNFALIDENGFQWPDNDDWLKRSF